MWFLIDTNVDIIKERTIDRDNSIYNTYQSLQYIRKRYLQFAYCMGIPIINNDQGSSSTRDKILEYLSDQRKYATIHNFMLYNMSRTKIEDYMSSSDNDDDFLYPLLEDLFGSVTESKRKSKHDIWLEKSSETDLQEVYRIHDKWDYFKRKIIIIIKNQSDIRYKNTFLEILFRNNISHCYYYCNNNGIILASDISHRSNIKLIISTPYLPLSKSQVQPQMRYIWNNPKYIININGVVRDPSESKWYHIYQSKLGRNRFIRDFISKYCQENMDEPIDEIGAKPELNIHNAKRNAFIMFFSLKTYFDKLGVLLRTLALEFNTKGNIICNDISYTNIDIVPIHSQSNSFAEKLNKVISQYTFLSQAYYKIYPYYETLKKYPNSYFAQLLPTIQKPILVKCDLYNNQPNLIRPSCNITYDYPLIQSVTLLPQILFVDNNQIRKKPNAWIYNTNKLFPIDSMLISSSYRSRNLFYLRDITEEILNNIPKDNLIIELFIDGYDIIISDDKINVVIIADYLSSLGVKSVSLLFLSEETHHSYIANIFLNKNFGKVYIGGNIDSIERLEFIWQIGAIPIIEPNNKIPIGEIYSAMLSANEFSEIPCVIQSTNNQVKGFILMNKDSIIKTCQDLLLWRYSRTSQKSILKGSSSKEYQKVLAISPNCDYNALLITVDDESNFCYTGSYSCFNQNNT